MDKNQLYLQRLDAIECKDSTYKPAQSPLVFASASGSIITDVEGKEYYDFCGGFGVLPFGHMPDYVKEGLGSAIKILHGMGDVYPTKDKIELLEEIKNTLPLAFTKIALSISGSGAIETALKTAMLKTKKTGFICFNNSYHGVDLGTLPVTFRNDFKEPFANFLPQANTVSIPLNSSFEDIEKAAIQLEKSVGLAGIIVEPIQGRGGIVKSKEQFLVDLRKISTNFGAGLIYDEIFCGLGRSGRMTFVDDFPCDIVCWGKALGGGLPLSACIGTEEFMSAWPQSNGEAIHTGTFFGHPLACKLGTLTLKKMAAEDICQKSLQIGRTILESFDANLKNNEHIKEIRNSGAMIGIEFKAALMAVKIFDLLRQKGVITLPSGPNGEVLSLTPAANFPPDQLKAGLKIIVETINTL